MTPSTAALALILLALTIPASDAAERRTLGAHEHGHGSVNIAIEDDKVLMELEIPGADIVGFEHQPKTKAEIDAVETAERSLLKGTDLFTFKGAACTLVAAEIEGHNGDHHDADHKAKSDEAIHSEFHVTYEFACKGAAALEAITFPFFLRFPDSKELEVNLISPDGQFRFEVDRASPMLELH